jgi:hypothetical protein
MQSRIPIYRDRPPLVRIMMMLVVLWSCSGRASEHAGSPAVAMTVTTTPSGASGIELEHMEYAVDPTPCARMLVRTHSGLRTFCGGSADYGGGFVGCLTCGNSGRVTGI